MPIQPPPRESIDLYLQELLALQFKASQGFNHKPTQGTLREKFVKSVVLEEFPRLQIGKGRIVENEWQSSEADFILLKESARIGTLSTYDLADIDMFMEIKSSVDSQKFKALNTVGGEIKSRCQTGHSIKIGMFTYSSSITKKTILERFGFKYDKSIDAFDSYNPDLDEYKNIDFVLCLDIMNRRGNGTEEAYFINRDIDGNCVFCNVNPVFGLFLNNFRR